MVLQEIILVPGIEHGFEKHAYDFETPHAAETSIRSVNAPTHHAETPVGDFLAQQIIFSIQRAFMEPAEFFELLPVKQHEHPRTEGTHQHGTILGDVVADVE